MSNEQAIARLEALIAKLRADAEPEFYCAACLQSMDDWLLTDVRVIIADGEEGFSDVTLLLCNDDLVPIADGLRRLGFIDHRHGSTSTLENQDCPGYEDMHACQTPTHYGNVTWGRRPLQEEEY